VLFANHDSPVPGRRRTASTVLRSSIAVVVVSGALGAAAVPTAVHAATSIPWGTVLISGSQWAGADAALGDLNVYSNGGQNTDQAGTFGLEYECTELAQRWAHYKFGEPATWPISKAADMWAVGPTLPLPLTQYPNGGALPPQYGDIVVFAATSANPTGHVGVVSAVKPGASVTIVQENFTVNGTPTGQWTLPMSGTTVAALGGDPVVGWLRDGSWQSLGGAIVGKPAAASSGPGQVTVVGVARDHSLWTRSLVGGGWSGWSSLGGYTDAGPTLASWRAGRLDLFVRGADHALWHRWAQNGVWSGWESLGGVLASAPAATSWGTNRLDAVVKGADGALWHVWWSASAGWSGWESLGGSLNSSPAAAAWQPGRLDVVVTWTDGSLRHLSFDGSWSWWEDLGGQSKFDPAIAAPAPYTLEIAAVATDFALLHQAYQNGWTGWSSLGGFAASAPALSSWGPGQVEIFVQGADGSVWYALGG
jgi:CHAP domain